MCGYIPEVGNAKRFFTRRIRIFSLIPIFILNLCMVSTVRTSDIITGTCSLSSGGIFFAIQLFIAGGKKFNRQFHYAHTIETSLNRDKTLLPSHRIPKINNINVITSSTRSCLLRHQTFVNTFLYLPLFYVTSFSRRDGK